MTVDREQTRRNAELYVYWCPRCEVQTDRGWHICRKGPPLIPQMDEETTCERIAAVPKAELEQAERRIEAERNARHAAESLNAEEVVRVRENWQAQVESEKARAEEAEKERDWEREVVAVDLREKLEQAERERDEALASLRDEEEAFVRQRGLKMDALAQLAKVPALVEAIENAMWNGYAWIGLSPCVSCGEEQPRHRESCELATALAAVEQEQKP